jgi:hypothetical protein
MASFDSACCSVMTGRKCRFASLLRRTGHARGERGFLRRGSHRPISDNTNRNAATNGQSLHTRRHWFAVNNPPWRSRTSARHPSQGGCCAPNDTQEDTHKGSVVAQSNPAALVLWNRLTARTNSRDDMSGWSYTANSSSNAFASFRSRVSKPSVNQLYTGASSSCACCT